jgi:hypothetical protein
MAIALVAGAIASPKATTVLPADLGELSRDARAVVRGRVVALDPIWADTHRSIETIVTLEVDALLKGNLGSSVQFRVPGGRLGRFESIMMGAPHFAMGERVIVFLGAHGPAYPHLLGLGQGVFRLTNRGARWLVTPPVIPSGHVGRVIRGDRARVPMPLADFERRVRELAAGAK